MRSMRRRKSLFSIRRITITSYSFTFSSDFTSASLDEDPSSFFFLSARSSSRISIMAFMLIKSSRNSVSEITGFSRSVCPSSSPHGEDMVLENVLLEPISGFPSTNSPSPTFNLDLVSIHKLAQQSTSFDTKYDS